ncbi:DoxX family protein [Anaerobacillus alkaliphilus]|uniref:DoxX family protein n=1 Tax=Anaerobacillus alkaliphilus TaxID=1548597 RepID=A0A4Q0VW97_9BACI|nr:DoxX family protein [Anaerobacillus alkaliphilus]RXJ02421.1 DoxX family protein [Anaerobacillus alkaliphilus]
MRNDIGALLLRITLGVVFLSHGLAKFQGGIENVVGWFQSIGLPGFMAYGVAGIEVIGGAALIVGLGTRVFSLLFSLILLGAIVKVKFAAGFLDGYAYDVILLAIGIHLSLNGSKFFSLDQSLFSNTKEHTYRG